MEGGVADRIIAAHEPIVEEHAQKLAVIRGAIHHGGWSHSSMNGQGPASRENDRTFPRFVRCFIHTS